MSLSSGPVFKATAALREAYRFHGLRLPWVVAHRFWVYRWRRLRGPHTFEFAGQTHRYWIHPYILDNERAIEIPIVLACLGDRRGRILEVGNVLVNYTSFPHTVVDKYERAPSVVNEDIVQFGKGLQFDRIVTISTLEHVGWDEEPREPDKIVTAISKLKELLAPGGELVATMPLGYNSHLDELVRTGSTGFPEVRFLRRISANNQWREAQLEEVVSARFGSPFSCANAVFVGRFERNGRGH